ncbi:MAG TPA: efflux RND transporter periplasmic adaptor subunit [Verrucomicrobiae bacterium]|nr:efflux RND transporter periplasmic adaptor subunit [Verrucomicrobiae bacterium]
MKLAASKMAVTLGLCLALGVSQMARAGAQNCEGITEPVFDVTLSMAVPGIMTVQRFKEGQFVQTNDVILELDSQLEELEVERRRLVMENRKADADSTKMVFDKTASVSRDELLKKEADYEVALAEYKIAVQELQRRKLIAPGAGVITEISLHVGEACSPYTPVARLVDTRQCYFISNIEAKAAAGLKTGEMVQLEIDDLKNPIKLGAKIVFVSPVVDSASGLQKIKAIFDNADGKVRPGVTGRMLFD